MEIFGIAGVNYEDNTNAYQWVVSSTKTKNFSNLSIPYDDAKKIELKEFVKLKEERMKRIDSRMGSKLPRGNENHGHKGKSQA